MSIPTVYPVYFQKSRAFLFPMLGIPKGIKTTPLQTYISWDGYIRVEDKKLICVYSTADASHELVAQDFLYTNPLFEDMVDLPGLKQRVYIFCLDLYKEDYQYFLSGKYSEFSGQVKKYIISYFGYATAEFYYIESYLYPQKYYPQYAELLNVNIDLLCEVTELCDLYDPEKENLKIIVKNLQKSTL